MSHAFLQTSMSCCVSHEQQLSCTVLRTNEFLLFHFILASGSTSTLTLVGLTITKCCNILLKNTSPRCSAEECKTQGLQVSSDGHPESLGILRQGWVSFSWVIPIQRRKETELLVPILTPLLAICTHTLAMASQRQSVFLPPHWHRARLFA